MEKKISEEYEKIIAALKEQDLSTIINSGNLEELEELIKKLTLAKKIMAQQKALNEPPKKYEDEMATRLQKIKKMFDKAYLETKIKYGKENADNAIRNYFLNYDYGFFTGKENKMKFKVLNEHPNEIYQVLLDYAISSYISEEQQGISHEVTLEEVKKYIDVTNTKLNYDAHYITSVVAIGTAWSPYWVTNLISCNPKLKTALVNDFIKGRYTSKEQRNALDNSKGTKIIKQDNGKNITMSKYFLNRCIENMNNDDMIEPFDPDEVISSKMTQEKSH